MGDCKNKPKFNCGNKQYANCVEYQTAVPEFSTLAEESCTSIEETTEDLYKLIEEDRDNNSTELLGNTCIEYDIFEGKIIIKNVLAKFEELLCQQQELITAQQETIETMQEQIATLQTNCN